MTLAALILGVVTAERLAELWLARANTRVLVSKGAHEVAAAHYPLIVLVHAAWLGGLWLLAWNAQTHIGWLIVFGAIQVLRVWTLSTLGRRWTTRIIVVPGERLVTRGPYRFMRHPNYAVVIAEIAVLPLCFGMPTYALVFTLGNALILTIRIRAENIALAEN